MSNLYELVLWNTKADIFQLTIYGYWRYQAQIRTLGLSRYQNFSIRYQYQWKSTVLGTNFGTKAKHKNMLIKKHIFINKVKQK